MNRVARLFILILAGLCHLAVPATEPAAPAEPVTPVGWSLPVLWQLAATQSPELARARASIEATEAGVKRARLAYMPRLSAQASYQDYLRIASVLTFAEPEPYSIFNVGVELSQTLFDGNKTKHDVSLARDELKQAQLAYEKSAEELLWSLSEQFFDAAVAQIEAAGLAPIEALATARLDVLENQLRAGVVDRLALFRTQGELESLQRTRLEAQLRRRLAESQLTQLLRAQPNFWQQHTDYVVPPAQPVDTTQPLPHQSAAVAMAELSLEMAETRWKQAASGYAPTIKATASASHLSRDTLRFDDRGTDATLGVTVSWGLDSALTARYDRREARAEIAVAEAAFEQARLEHMARVQSTRLRWQQARDTVTLLESSATRQTARVEAVQQAISSGLYDRSFLLTEEQSLRQTELDLQIARIELRRQQYLTAALNRRTLP